jgi:nicotinate phosphoribosyltransferase
MRGDVLSLESDRHDGEALVVPVMRGGKCVAPVPTLAQIRERAKRNLARLPEPLRLLKAGAAYPVEIAAMLKALAAEMDAKARS